MKTKCCKMATFPTPGCKISSTFAKLCFASENANGISIFASKPCTHGFRNLKYWDIRSSINLVPVIPVGVASSH
ncbi:hypothetical protein T4D_14198 [Trichinella pseudospiralis]|uniref:Uncharacterized protein n=1 Tax=Trichinella pseudospiralis TaxID=6337 RepID=A0A0V1FGJ6_TRIPS|nr:hypothetical protein T4D_14198 [Trichinella pseudospiralis]